MAIYAEINDSNVVVNIIDADADFINSLPNKDDYILSDGKKNGGLISSEWISSADCFRLEKPWTTFIWSDGDKDWIAPTDGITPLRHAEASDRSDISALYLQYEDYFNVTHVTEMLENLDNITYDPINKISFVYSLHRYAFDYRGYTIPDNSAFCACAYDTPGEGTVATDYYNEVESYLKSTYGIQHTYAVPPIKHTQVTEYCKKAGMTNLHNCGVDERVVNNKIIGEIHLYGKGT